MVKVRDLYKNFGDLMAVDGLTFDVAMGESVALWGENGAGKTTALRCLLGVIDYEGLVQIGDYRSDRQGKAARRLLGFVPQEISFHDDMTVTESLTLYARLKKTTIESQYTEDLLTKLGLTGHVGKKVGDLSGGMKQRLALVIALLADPPLLILDEPTANLDLRAREEFLALLTGLRESGKTLVFSSHRLEEVVALADRVLVLEAGRLVVACTPAELSDHLGSKTMLKLHLANEEWIGPAVEALTSQGFYAEQNGTGIWVEVVPLEKARPISLLTEAGIPVDDFQMDSGK